MKVRQTLFWSMGLLLLYLLSSGPALASPHLLIQLL
jgi:hypothetical protein